MKIRFILWSVLVVLTAFGLFAVKTLHTQQSIAEKTIRLHVVANSDTDADQAQKLRVRDAVLNTVGKLTADCTTASEARKKIAEHLPQIQAAAEAVLSAEGSTYAVDVTLGTENFDTRYYETFTLPAGRYPSLRVSIGEAKGHNWWCVVFPSLCFAATSDAVQEYAAVGGFDESEADFIIGGEEDYVLEFKTLEWLQKLFSLFS